VGARERKVWGRASSAAGMKFSWPEKAMFRSSLVVVVGDDMLFFGS